MLNWFSRSTTTQDIDFFTAFGQLLPTVDWVEKLFAGTALMIPIPVAALFLKEVSYCEIGLKLNFRQTVWSNLMFPGCLSFGRGPRKKNPNFRIYVWTG